MDFTYSIVDGIDHIIEEQGTQFTALRKVRWGDSDKAYLELRRWRNTPDGGEQAAKGCTFMTEDGPSTLTETLVEMGYGNTKEVVRHLYDRDNFKASVNAVFVEKEAIEFNEKEGTALVKREGKVQEVKLPFPEAGTPNDNYYDPTGIIRSIEHKDDDNVIDDNDNDEEYYDPDTL